MCKKEIKWSAFKFLTNNNRNPGVAQIQPSGLVYHFFEKKFGDPDIAMLLFYKCVKENAKRTKVSNNK